MNELDTLRENRSTGLHPETADITAGSRINRAMWVAALIGTLAGCEKPIEDDPSARVGGSLTAMDYEPTDTFVRPVYVNGYGGDSAGNGGSTVLTGFTLPQRWLHCLTVHVKWRRCRAFHAERPETEEEACHWVEKDVPVHPYSYVGRTWVHIFANEQVLVIPAMLAPGHPDYPGADLPYKNFGKRRGIGNDE